MIISSIFIHPSSIYLFILQKSIVLFGNRQLIYLFYQCPVHHIITRHFAYSLSQKNVFIIILSHLKIFFLFSLITTLLIEFHISFHSLSQKRTPKIFILSLHFYQMFLIDCKMSWGHTFIFEKKSLSLYSLST